jgi:hypothetical protein
VHSNSHSNSLGMVASCAGTTKIARVGSQVGGMERKLRAGVRTEEKLGCRPMYQIL